MMKGLMGVVKIVGAGAVIGAVAGVIGARYVHDNRDRLRRQVNRAMNGAENAVGNVIQKM